ncbi:MAG: hypothetical protein IKP40_08405 [Clostridia bacterium]|nr:hypothetical protein [Clostridia bacterium]
MTQETLAALGVNGEAAEAVLSALREAGAEAERLRGEMRRAELRQGVRDALLRQGARPDSVGLLALAVNAEQLNPDEPLDEAGLAEPLRAAYPSLFRAELPAISPPGGAALDAGGLGGMSVEEINARWDSVKAALAQGT